jgi:galactokinase
LGSPSPIGDFLSGPRDGATGWEAPVRVCLAGENLDWIGGRSTCVAVALLTRVRRHGTSDVPGSGALRNLTWRHISQSLGGLAHSAPPVSIEQAAPRASGLATSSALTMCLLQVQLENAAAEPLTRAEVIQLAYELEREVAQGGGMDQLCIAHGGALLSDGNDRGLPRVLERRVWPEGWSFLVVDSGIAKHSPTRIADIRKRLEARDPDLLRYVELADDYAASMWRAISDRRLDELCRLLDSAHCAMRDHQGSSTPEIERLRAVLLDSGCAGVKLTGAGGGGAIFTVCEADKAPDLADQLQDALKSEGLSSNVVVVAADHDGLRPCEVGASRRIAL